MKNELVSMRVNGSWYQVAYVHEGSLYTFTTQGIKKTQKALKYFHVVHTPGKPYMVDTKIHLDLFKKFLTVEK